MSVVNAGTSVFALKYKDGIMFAADTSITYGSMMKHKKAQRISTVGEESLFACSGEMADFQNLKKMLAEKYEEDLCENDGACFLHPKDYFNWVARMQYQKRLKSDPIMVTALFGGIHNKTKEPFLDLLTSMELKSRLTTFSQDWPCITVPLSSPTDGAPT